MRILICGCTYAPALNGQSTFTTTLAEGLVQCGHQVWMVAPSDYGKSYQIERNGVYIYRVHSQDLKFFHDEAYMSWLPDGEVRHIFNLFKPDIVHVQDPYPLSKCVVKFARLNQVAVLGTNHFVPENLAPYIPLLPKAWPVLSRLLWWWMKRVYSHLDFVTAPSRTAVEILMTQNLSVPMEAISCGVSFERFHVDATVDRAAIRRRYGLNETSTTFLFVGRVDAEKKVDVLIHALKLLNRADIQLVVTGNGAALHSYQALAQELGIEAQVHFTGFVTDGDLPLLLNSVDVFSMPSEAELLSIASLEAMASGRPLLVARSKALPELVDDGVNGYLFEPGNVEDAARCMALFADHPENWAQMGAASLQKVIPHGFANVLKRYEEVYTGCIGGVSR